VHERNFQLKMRSGEREAPGARQSGGLKKWLIERVPARVRPAARHWYRRLLSRLDPEMELLAPLLEAHTVAIDVGAAQGDYTYYFARHGLVVEAFEPQSEPARVLRAMRGAKVCVHALALSDTTRQARLAVPVVGGLPISGRASLASAGRLSPGAQMHEVECRTLDSYGFAGVSVVKVDAEGHESAVLRGAAETLAREHPILLLELELRHIGRMGWHEVLAWLGERGYRGYYHAGSGSVAPIETFSHERYQRLRGEVPLAPYVNNFIFLPAEGARSKLRFHVVVAQD
jgi:FkbM family methyltransferase